MTDTLPLLDPWTADTLLPGRLDPARTIAVSEAEPGAAGRAIAALANSRGGDLLLGVEMGADGAVTGVAPIAAAESVLADAIALVDPPVAHLVRTRTAPAGDGQVLVVRVRQSPSTPHLVSDTGTIPRLDERGLRPVQSRRELDDLYARGRGERERADRLIDAMIEKLTISHYAFYTLALIACTHTPSAEPYRRAVDGGLVTDPFARAHDLGDQPPHIRPGEIELRSEGETGVYLRVTRNGCVAVGELHRRPYHEQLDTAETLQSRIEALAAAACRLLQPAADSVVVPHVFAEGIRGLRLVLNPEKRLTSGQAPQDTARYALTLGDANDQEYPARLAGEAVSRFAALFPPTGE